MNILGISGKRETGKSTLAKFLVADHGFVRVSLAGWLKAFCKHQFGLVEEQVNGAFKESPTLYRTTTGAFLTPRDILIQTGAFFRSIDSLFFCKKLEEAMRLQPPETNFVIDDIRFHNELNYFRALGAKFIRLDRFITKPPILDPGETELDDYVDWDALLINELNRVPDDLKKFADYVSVRV